MSQNETGATIPKVFTDQALSTPDLSSRSSPVEIQPENQSPASTLEPQPSLEVIEATTTGINDTSRTLSVDLSPDYIHKSKDLIHTINFMVSDMLTNHTNTLPTLSPTKHCHH
jgi:hypothetical protein